MSNGNSGDSNGGNERLVGYTVKELLAELNRKVDIIDQKMDRKADHKDVEALVIRATALELRTSSIESALARIAVNTQELESLNRRMTTFEAIKKQSDELGKIYLGQWQDMQTDMQGVKTDVSNLKTSKEDSMSYKKLYFPIAVSIGLSMFILIINFIKDYANIRLP